MSNSRDFSGKVALVTGSSSGIGEETVIQLSRLGANVIVTGRSENGVKSVAEKCRQSALSSNKVLEVIADLKNDDDIRLLLAVTINEFGKIDILVNNAAVCKAIKLTESNITRVMETYSEIMDTNVRSVLMLTSLAVPYLEITKGTVINISSIASLRPFAMFDLYCMSKCALDMFTKCLALELGPKGIRVNSVNPAAIRTPIFEKFGISGLKTDMIAESCERDYPLKKIGEPMDVAATIVFLASDDASFITGITMPVDGGALYSAPISTLDNYAKI